MEPIVYSAESSLRRPWSFIKSALNDMYSARTRELAWQLARRNIAASYRQSLLGYAWGVLPTIAIAIALSIAARNRVIQFGTTNIPFAAYVIIGLALWQTFIEALMGPLSALHQARPMLARINLPKEALILSKLWELLVNLAAKLLLVAGVIAWYGLPLAWSAFLAPFGILTLIILGTALGLLVSPIGLLYDDVRRTLPLVAQFGLIVTPVVYALPEAGTFATIVRFNPVTPLLTTTREWLTGENATLVIPFLWVASGSFVAMVIGVLGLRLVSPFAIERISS